jgi:hypothetical protein
MLVVIIYLIGVVLSYLIHRWDWKHKFNEWTVENRKFALRMATISWLGVIPMIVIIIFDRISEICDSNDDDIPDNKRPAKW